jgi:putative nucleotidyltransferase with HDIG domain
MNAKKKPKPIVFSIIANYQLYKIRRGPASVAASTFLISLVLIVAGSVSIRDRTDTDLGEFEVGRVADREVFAEQSVSYTDEEATRLHIAQEERQVPAVFLYSGNAGEEALNAYDRFVKLSGALFDQQAAAEAYRRAVQAELPGAFVSEILDMLFRDPGRDRLLEYGREVLEHLLGTGIFALPQLGLDAYNPDTVELVRRDGIREERERIPYGQIVTSENVRDEISRYIAGSSFPASFTPLAAPLLGPFITENVFFSPDETRARQAEVRSQVEPVIRYIEQGERVIRKGFIINNSDMVRFRAVLSARSGYNPRPVIGRILVVTLAFGVLLLLGGWNVIGQVLSSAEIYLISILALVYMAMVVFLGTIPWDIYLLEALVAPTALVVMLSAILISVRLATILTVMLSLAGFLSGSFDAHCFIFSMVSGIAAAFVLQKAEKRMDLIKAGLILAATNIITSLGLLLIEQAALANCLSALFLAGANGFVSCLLVLGLLPLMEHVLNAATPFRLIELSDLNAPVLKRLFTAAPGTYGHSVMVANLAEAACQEIGANALLARVGAYYHDIGKMEQPEYFVENQTMYNKHNDIPPRLSATVIRSHVKIGVEKGRHLGLPREVIDIIAEHHGNSVISWFYHEALKRETNVNVEDFTYPGSPPHSRESAVVMLADVTEAAVRTLKKPTAARLEKFIQELIMSKFEQGQLWDSGLTFRDLRTVKNTFVRVLAGHYHSRIEYPKQPLREAVSAAAQSLQGEL